MNHGDDLIPMMRRSLTSLLIMCLSLLWGHEAYAVRRAVRPRQSLPSEQVKNTARSLYAALVMDAQTGRILHEDRAFELRIPASLTKIMTAYVAFQEIRRGRLKLKDRVVFSRFAASREPSKFGLRPGQSLSVKDAIMVMLVRSCNDAAEALGEKIGGSTKAFGRLMTLEARRIGLKHTHFYNASGLPHPLQKTTAYDMALLSRALLQNCPQFISWFNVKHYACQGRVLTNTNKLLGPLPGHQAIMIDGLKTGRTQASGSNLIATARSGHKRWIVVVMGQPNRHARDQKTVDLLKRFVSSLRHTQDDVPDDLYRHVRHAPVTQPFPSVEKAPQPFRWGIQIGIFKEFKRAQEQTQKVQKWAKNQGWKVHTEHLKIRHKGSQKTKVILWALSHKEAEKLAHFLEKKGIQSVMIRNKTVPFLSKTMHS